MNSLTPHPVTGAGERELDKREGEEEGWIERKRNESEKTKQRGC